MQICGALTELHSSSSSTSIDGQRMWLGILDNSTHVAEHLGYRNPSSSSSNVLEIARTRPTAFTERPLTRLTDSVVQGESGVLQGTALRDEVVQMVVISMLADRWPSVMMSILRLWRNWPGLHGALRGLPVQTRVCCRMQNARILQEGTSTCTYYGTNTCRSILNSLSQFYILPLIGVT